MDVKNLFSLAGRKGFITGGAQGIGKTIAEAYAELGADVAIVDMNIKRQRVRRKRSQKKQEGISLHYNAMLPIRIVSMT